MKKIIFLIVAILGINTIQAQYNFFEWNQDEEVLISARVDPTFNDNGFQIGLEITKELEWGWTSLGISYYEELQPSYTDLIGSGGINFHLFYTDAIKYYTGPRLGINVREGNPFPLMGYTTGFDIKIIDGVRVGLRYFFDYRADQDPSKYGGNTKKNPIIFHNPMIVENTEFILTFKI